MKIQKLQKILILNSVILTLILAAFAAVYYFISETRNSYLKENKLLQSEIRSLKAKKIKIENKIQDVKKYSELLLDLPENKKSTKAIRIDEINAILGNLALKYDISNQVIKMALPQPLDKGFFKKNKITVYFTEGSIRFESYHDVNAIHFVEDFINEVPGNLIITKFSLKKIGEYGKDKLIAISKGKNSGNVEAEVNFTWYSYRDQKK